MPKKEFKTLVIKLLIELRKIIDEHSENFNKELENIKKDPIRNEEFNNWNNTIKQLNRRLNETMKQKNA